MAAPKNCETTKKGMSDSLIPEKLSVKLRPNVTAGLANLVDDVNQYPAVI